MTCQIKHQETGCDYSKNYAKTLAELENSEEGHSQGGEFKAICLQSFWENPVAAEASIKDRTKQKQNTTTTCGWAAVDNAQRPASYVSTVAQPGK